MKAWTKGVSGNPGGRPRKFREKLEQLFGQDVEQAYAFLQRVINGGIKAAVKDRIDAAIFICEQMHGKATTRNESLNFSMDVEYRSLTNEQLAERIAELSQTNPALASALEQRRIGGPGPRIQETSGNLKS
jgi:hypothetical protein